MGEAPNRAGVPSRKTLAGVALASMITGVAVNPLALRWAGFLLYTQPVPKSGFWLLSVLAIGFGLLLVAAMRFALARRLALAWFAGSLAILGTEAVMRLRPPVEVTGASRTPTVHFNSLGTWDAEPRFEAAVRILVLGDSITHGVGDFLDNTCRYHDQIESQLAKEGHDIDVESVAESAWALNRYIAEYQRFAPKYRPQIVLIGWCMNDINYGNDATTVEGNAEGGNRPQMQSLRWRLGQFARKIRLNESFLCTLIEKRSSLLLKNMGILKTDWLDVHQTTYYKRMRDLWQNPSLLAQIRGDLKFLKDDCDQHGRKLLIAIFPFSFQVNGDGSAIQTHKKLLQELGIQFVDLADAFRATGNSDALFSYRDEAHPNRDGHKVAYEALLPMVRKLVIQVESKPKG